MKLYKIDTYEAYRADEKGVGWYDYVPNDTAYYKHDVIEELDVENINEAFNLYTDDDGKPFVETADNILCLNMETLKWEQV